MTTEKRDKGGVVITGASTGIGRACAIHLDSLGFRVFAGVRRESDGRGLRVEASERLSPLLSDVTDGDSIRAAAAHVAESVGERGVRGVVNNAGTVVSAPLEFVPIAELRNQFEVNVVGQIAVTQAFLPLLRRRSGRVVNIGSVGGRVALPFIGPYAASKFAMEALTDSLRRELRPWGIPVSIVEPGGIATPIWKKSAAAAEALIESLPPEAHELYGDAFNRALSTADRMGNQGLPAERVARVVAHALTARKPKTRYLIGREARARVALSRVLPDRVFDRLVARSLGL